WTGRRSTGWRRRHRRRRAGAGRCGWRPAWSWGWRVRRPLPETRAAGRRGSTGSPVSLSASRIVLNRGRGSVARRPAPSAPPSSPPASAARAGGAASATKRTTSRIRVNAIAMVPPAAS
ncbi:MAG: hypothetical protein AVDCRST_MAG59-2984, partial [uncultured Thermomicrobiales bacterium]